jgi:hypothetical protein
MRVMRRPYVRRHARWHPHVSATAGQPVRGPGGFVIFDPGSAGAGDLPNLPGSDLWFNGMDPSNPATWVRPYNPQPGMISYLNLDGARPNPAGGVQRGQQPPLMGAPFRFGGVPGSSVNNG